MLFLFCFSLLAHAGDLNRFSVFTEESIQYRASDFEGPVAAGGSVSVERFRFAGSGGLEIGGDFSLKNGGIDHNRVSVGGQSLLQGMAWGPGRWTGGVAVLLKDGNLNGTVHTKLMNIALRNGNLTGTVKEIVPMSAKESLELQQSLEARNEARAEEMRELSAGYATMSESTPEFVDGELRFRSDIPCRAFKIEAAQLKPGRILRFLGKGNIIVNVYGDTAELVDIGTRGAREGQVLWNFPEAESLLIARSGSSEPGRDGRALGIAGSVLAPLAKVYFYQGLITGSLWARALDGNHDSAEIPGGQVNLGRFAGCPAAPSAAK